MFFFGSDEYKTITSCFFLLCYYYYLDYISFSAEHISCCLPPRNLCCINWNDVIQMGFWLVFIYFLFIFFIERRRWGGREVKVSICVTLFRNNCAESLCWWMGLILPKSHLSFESSPSYGTTFYGKAVHEGVTHLIVLQLAVHKCCVWEWKNSRVVSFAQIY